MDKVQEKKQHNVLRMAVVTSFITTFMGSALNLSIPNLEEQFQVSGAMVGWVVTAFTIAVAAFSVPMGKIADAKGRRKVLIIGISTFAVLSFLCAFSTTIWMLLALRVLQGVAAAMIFSTNNAILISVFPGSERGRVLGLSTAAVYVGLSVGPVVGGVLNTRLGWQSIFFVTCGVAIAALVLAIIGAPERQTEVLSVDFDLAGNILYIVMIIAFLYGLTNLSISKYGWMIMTGGLILCVLFVMVERKAADPVDRKSTRLNSSH